MMEHTLQFIYFITDLDNIDWVTIDLNSIDLDTVDGEYGRVKYSNLTAVELNIVV